MHITRQMKLPRSKQLDSLAREAAKVYNEALDVFNTSRLRDGVYLKRFQMHKLVHNDKLHSCTVQGVIDTFMQGIQSWDRLRQSDQSVLPPYKKKDYFLLVYKSIAIYHHEGKLVLSNGRKAKNEPIVLDWPYDKPCWVTITFKKGEYQLNAIYDTPPEAKRTDGAIAGIDLGECCMAAANIGDKTLLLSGKALRSEKRLHDKVRRSFDSKLVRCKLGSKRHKKLTNRKYKSLNHIENRIRDIEHKQTAKLVQALTELGAGTAVIGFVPTMKRPATQRQMPNWSKSPMHKTRSLLSYKCERQGITTVFVDETLSSQTCPSCGLVHKSDSRIFRCSGCGFAYHRDGVAAMNIRFAFERDKLYRERVPVDGGMAPPIGLLYDAKCVDAADCCG